MAPAEAAQGRAPAAVEKRSDALERGRRAYAARAWKDAYKSLSFADQAAPLDGADLELLATSAGMLGLDEHLSALERAHHAYLEAGETLRAVRCAFWVGTFSAQQGELARATGWFGARGDHG